MCRVGLHSPSVVGHQLIDGDHVDYSRMVCMCVCVYVSVAAFGCHCVGPHTKRTTTEILMEIHKIIINFSFRVNY
jgi:hypothetical protein